MGCGCSGSTGRSAPPPRPPRAGDPPPPLGSAQGAVGEPNYYFTGPPRPDEKTKQD